MSLSKNDVHKLPTSLKPFTIHAILKYYGTNIAVWMLAYLILGFLQFEKPTFSLEYIGLNFSYAIWSGLFAGLIWGSVFKITIQVRQRLSNYLGTVVLSTLVNIFSVFLLVYCFYHFKEMVNMKDVPQTLSQLFQFYRSDMFYILLLHGFIVALMYQFVYEMDRKLGRGVLLKFLLGQYHRPTEEKRVFLFMDLKSSTYYAEQLGHFKYSRLIQDCFNDLSSSVIRNKAQIYQFVGDEVVLTWQINRNFNAGNCIQSFTDFTKKLTAKKKYYMDQYGMLPIFKAGLHAGKVMVAQVGQLKSEIAYHGDAINTASRVQELCNTYQSPLLFTNSFFKLLNSNEKQNIKFESLGKIGIKGKNNLVDMYRIIR